MYNFDFVKFIENQEKICDKFPVPSNRRNISEALDTFILHIMEESYESHYQSSNTEEYQLEIIDILMYLGSMYVNLLKYRIYFDFNIKNSCIPDIKESHKNIDIHVNNKFNHILPLDEIIYPLMKIRVMFPERKYHKPYKELTVDEDIKRIDNSLEIVYNLCHEILNRYLILPYEDVIELLHEKQNYILSL